MIGFVKMIVEGVETNCFLFSFSVNVIKTRGSAGGDAFNPRGSNTVEDAAVEYSNMDGANNFA